MSDFFDNNVEQFKLYGRAKGSLKAQKILKALGKTEGFASAFNTKIGQEVLMDAVQEAEILLDKIVDETAKAPDIAEFRALKKIIKRWTGIWAAHQTLTEELQSAE